MPLLLPTRPSALPIGSRSQLSWPPMGYGTFGQQSETAVTLQVWSRGWSSMCHLRSMVASTFLDPVLYRLEAPLWRCWLADRIHFGLLCSTRGAEVSPEARRLSLGHLQSSGGCELLSHCGETTPLAVSRSKLRHCIRCLRSHCCGALGGGCGRDGPGCARR